MNTLRKMVCLLLLMGVVACSMPASAIDSDFPSLKELARKATDAVHDIKKGITGETEDGYIGRPGRAPDNADSEQKRLLGLIFILVGVGLVMLAFYRRRQGFGQFVPLMPGLLLVLFLWWLFPLLPVFLLFIPMVGFKLMRQTQHQDGTYYPPAQSYNPPPEPAETQNVYPPSVHPVYQRKTIVVNLSGKPPAAQSQGRGKYRCGPLQDQDTEDSDDEIW